MLSELFQQIADTGSILSPEVSDSYCISVLRMPYPCPSMQSTHRRLTLKTTEENYDAKLRDVRRRFNALWAKTAGPEW